MCVRASFSDRSSWALPACEIRIRESGGSRREASAARKGVLLLAQVAHDADVEVLFHRTVGTGGFGGLVDNPGLLPVVLLELVEAGLLEHD